MSNSLVYGSGSIAADIISKVFKICRHKLELYVKWIAIWQIARKTHLNIDVNNPSSYQIMPVIAESFTPNRCYIDCLYEVAVYQICWRFFSHCLVRLIACLSVMGEDRSACSWHQGPNQIPGLELAGADMSSLSALICFNQHKTLAFLYEYMYYYRYLASLWHCNSWSFWNTIILI